MYVLLASALAEDPHVDLEAWLRGLADRLAWSTIPEESITEAEFLVKNNMYKKSCVNLSDTSKVLNTF